MKKKTERENQRNFLPEVVEVDSGLDVSAEVVVEQQLQVELHAGREALQELVAGQLLENQIKILLQTFSG